MGAKPPDYAGNMEDVHNTNHAIWQPPLAAQAIKKAESNTNEGEQAGTTVGSPSAQRHSNCAPACSSMRDALMKQRKPGQP